MRSLVTKTQPNLVRPLADTIRRMQSGNLFGVVQIAVEYDTENGDDEIPNTELDVSDPLTSRQQATEAMLQIHQGISELQRQSEINKKAAELAEKKKAFETLDGGEN